MFTTIPITILLLPLLGFVLMIFFGKKLSRQGDWLSSGLISISLLLSLYLLITKLGSHSEEMISNTFTWAIVGSTSIEIGIAIDNLAAVMLVVVTLVSTLVHFFSMGYMKDDVRYSRYYAYLGLFSFSMLGIVITNNL
ncbi:MAG: NAD(P)H-quinone oxidoreductase subunit F, partial [Balneolaceae bacterium]|nr:NAD(P)H-quinone oxidoreductase subunit F [Balneolaceae bacterium]